MKHISEGQKVNFYLIILSAKSSSENEIIAAFQLPSLSLCPKDPDFQSCQGH